MSNEVHVALRDTTRDRLWGQRRTIQPGLVQFAFDVAATMLALTFASLLGRWLVDGLGWPLGLPEDLASEAWSLAVVLLGVPAAKAMLGLYPGYGISMVERTRRQILILGWSAFTLILVDTYVHDGQWGVALVTLTVLPLTGLVVMSDILARKVLQRLRLWGRPCAVYGAGAEGAELARRLKRNPHLGFDPVLFVDEDSSRWGTEVQGVPVVSPAELSEGARAANEVATAVIAQPGLAPAQLKQRLDVLPYRTVLLMPDLPGFETLNTRVRDVGGILALEFNRHLRSGAAPLLKRGMDILGAALLLVAVAPLLGLIALAVKLDSPGPVLFRQKRWAGGTKAFEALKFRTMHVDAEQRLAELLASDPEMQAEYEVYHKLSRDPRITRVGRILRRISFDELPQLWNVITGDMSLIGPRPYMPHELAPYPAEREVMARVRPGITGLWQVSGRHRTTFQERIAYDVYYVENYSIWLDLYILVRTVVTVLKADGA